MAISNQQKEKASDRLKELMRKNHYSQKQLAREAGLSLSAIAGFYHGYSIPWRRNLLAIAKVFRINPDWLSGETDEKYYMELDAYEDEPEPEVKEEKSVKGYRAIVVVCEDKIV